MSKSGRLWAVLIGSAIFLMLVPLHAAAAPLSTIVVTNNLDETTNANGCSLREAITNSNNNAATYPDCAAGVGQDNIIFAIAPGGLQTINVTGSPLPAITDPVTLDATTQSGYAGAPLIELNGSAAGDADGLLISAGKSLVRGFVINQFTDNGINLTGAGGNRIEGNYIGTDVTGTLARGNQVYGIAIDSDNNTIGGPVARARNLISGNAQTGISLTFGVHQGNLIENNYIGTDIYGAAALPNGDDGIRIAAGAHENTVGGTIAGTGNLISGNVGNGIAIYDQLTIANVIAGNLIGTDVTGKKALANTVDGIYMFDGPADNTIGGTVPAARNIISGNGNNGIQFKGHRTHNNLVAGNYIGTDISGTLALGNGSSGISSQDSPSNAIGTGNLATRNVISGNLIDGITIQGKPALYNLIKTNFIGTDVTGMVALKNQQMGVHISGAPNTQIGGGSPSDGNVISANAIGVLVDGDEAVGTLFENNMIGTAVDGKTPLGNFNEGIFINGAPGSFIGSTTPGSGNLIAYNNTGIVIGSGSSDEVSVGNQMVGNSIHDNALLGIDLGGSETVTPNDADDPDLGPNRLQNFPVISSAQVQSGLLHIQGNLDSSTANSAYPVRVEYFSNSACDANGYGEGHTYLGFTSLTAPGDFTADLIVSVPEGAQLTATATDANMNSSEFSECTPIGSIPDCGTTPDAPTILAPTNGSRSRVQKVPLDWTDVKCASSYNVVVRRDAKNGTRVFHRSGLTESEIVTKALPPQTSYFFRARACNSLGCGPWTPWTRFRVAKGATP